MRRPTPQQLPEPLDHFELRAVAGLPLELQVRIVRRGLLDRLAPVPRGVIVSPDQYLDNARYYSKPCVKEWLKAHRQFRLVPLPAYSPNLNLIERLWKFLRKKALNRWLKTFEEMQAAVAGVLDRLGDYRDELSTLMTERFAIVEVEPAVA